ncbi:MAG: TolC family outer membrane protein [Proteobacteria bacterium]|nr:TolC family outer membrane protein [Pseudomonadota bacterium]
MQTRVERSTGRRGGFLVGLLGLGCTVFAATGASAQTMEEALALAYTNNPDLRASRANLRVDDEGVPQAKSGWRPTVSSTLTLGGTYVDSTSGTSTTSNISSSSIPRTAIVSINQPLYRGGRTAASVRRATSNVQAERSRMFSVEQNVLLNAATAYVDTMRDGSVLRLQINNLSRLQKQLEATRDRFAVGEVTRTDVAQAESRVARAQADRTQAEGNLVSRRAVFERIVGIVPSNLVLPSMPKELPQSLEESVEIATGNNFSLVTAKFEEVSAIEQIAVVQGELLPTVNVVAQASHSQDTGGSDNENTSVTLEAQINIPLYQAGAVSARVRSAKEEANRRRILVESSRREVVDTSARAYEAWTTAVARATSLSAEVASAQIALEGVEQEATVGARTVLDVLDAEQEMLDAQVGLVRAERDSFVASYQLLLALGRLTAASLGLPVEVFDYDRHFVDAEDRYFGTDVSPGQP